MPVESFEKWSPKVHEKAFVHPMATLIGDVEIGDEATVWPSVVLRGDHGKISIGARTSIQDGTVAHATDGISSMVIGDEVTVGHRVVLHGCRVGNKCLIGMGSVLLDNCDIGEGSLLGAGSLVTQGKKFPPRSFLLGSPAKRLRDVTAEELQWIEYSWRAYQDLCRRYRAR